jgi:hypothetical protein
MAHGHTTFVGLFNDASCDTFLVGRTYDAFLAPFNITPGDGSPAPIVVRKLIAASTNQHLPIALLILVDGRLMPLFLPFKQEHVMGVAEHAATDSKMFAFKGEMVGTQGYLFELRDKTFNLTPHTTVPDVGTVCGLLTANLQTAAVGPFNNGDANTATVRTQCVVPLLNKYAALFLANVGGLLPNITSRPSSPSSRPMVWQPLVSRSRISAWQQLQHQAKVKCRRNKMLPCCPQAVMSPSSSKPRESSRCI